MRVVTIREQGRESAWVLAPRGFVAVEEIARRQGWPWSNDLFTLLQTGDWFDLLDWYRTGGQEALERGAWSVMPREDAILGPLYRTPGKIWGIGLNYSDHAKDLSEVSPTAEPGSFMKPATSIIGPEDPILLPRLSQKTTGEAELGLVFGRRCRHVPRAEWQSVLAGFTTIIDMTAEDILRRNPRNLTQCKSFDTFFSFGPILVSPDEVGDVLNLQVTTMHNGKPHATNVVRNMTFPPDFLVAYHSEIMTMLPGDVLSTGTPGAAPLANGDRIECHIEGFDPHGNPVKDLKAGA